MTDMQIFREKCVRGVPATERRDKPGSSGAGADTAQPRPDLAAGDHLGGLEPNPDGGVSVGGKGKELAGPMG